MSIDTQCVGTNKERRRLLRGLSGKVAAYLAKTQGVEVREKNSAGSS